jgi:hypothetical protein
MSTDTENNILRKLQVNKKFAFQLDESTDVSGNLFVRFIEWPEIIEQFLFCRQLETRTTDADIFAAVNTYFQEKGLFWINCISICSDGTAAMTGHIKGFLSFAQKENSLFSYYTLLSTSRSAHGEKHRQK